MPVPFEKVDPQADFPALEREILAFWASAGIFDKRRALNAGKPKWSFLDGPITANNPMGVHHAWNRTYKDVFNRYFAMTGHELRYQQGFDCQGLWVEVEVEKELGLGSKRDIENLVPGDPVASIAKFVQLCKDRVNKFARVQTEQSVRLGYWMDWDRTDADWAKPVDERKSYFTMSEENNYTIWAFLKKCSDKGLIYRGYDAMPWCGRCGVGLSEMEVKEGYKTIEHRAVFVRFALKDKPNEYLLVWTTTPWTMSSNVGAAVNPELTYIKVKLKGDVYYVAKGAFKLNRMESSGGEGGDDSEPEASGGKKSKREWLDGVPHLKSLEQLFKEKAGKDAYEIVGEVKGADMLGWEYTAPFDDLEAQNCECGYPHSVAAVAEQRKWTPKVTARAVHRVIAWKDVGETEGTGIVHIAPGCGQADFELGKENGLPPVAPLDDGGVFLPGFGPLAGLNAVDPKTADAVFDLLKQRDALFATERYVHRYPHCWRCKTELLFRLVDEWFINMGPRPEYGTTGDGSAYSFRQEVMKVTKQVQFLPESIGGQAREYDWLYNMGDWMISKKRFWGLALPIWVDEVTGDFEVIGSREELQARAVEGWEEFEGQSPHRPFVDRVRIRNPKTGNLMSRVPDVGNPWLDAGIVAFSTMKYNTDRQYWREWYPADFITESFPGQFRNWFYALLALSTMMSDGEPPFKRLLGFALVKDQVGQNMSKTVGNAPEFIAAADEGFTLVHKLKPKEKPSLPEGALAFSETKTFDPDSNQMVPAVRASYPPIGADVMRWLYCRQNPSQNLLFGPGPANEVRSKFIFKLWNTYAFFCNCAAGDGFDPAMPEVPFRQRPDLDRWILSSLKVLIHVAKMAFEKYDVMSFALAVERFVDDDLSNWYVRRVKPRLNSKVSDLNDAGLKDKWAAYQTLHTVLTTMCRLLAPCVPFVTEVMWRNLTKESDSVHLNGYPADMEIDQDAEVKLKMDRVRYVISLGASARNVAKLSVRQPLAELRVRSADADTRNAVVALQELIQEELNVLSVTLLPVDAPPALNYSVKLNKKTAAEVLGAKLREVESVVAGMNGDELHAQLMVGEIELCGVKLSKGHFSSDNVPPKGWAGARGYLDEVLVSTVITEELKLAGLARNVIRLVNQARKDAKLDIADAITLHLSSTAEQLAKAIAAHKVNIATEVQATAWSEAAVGHRSEVAIEGMLLVIAFSKKD